VNWESFKLGIYRHYKGGEYRVLFVGKGQFKDEALDMQDMVVYESLDENTVSKHWVRPLTDFLEMMVVDENEVPRFSFVREA